MSWGDPLAFVLLVMSRRLKMPNIAMATSLAPVIPTLVARRSPWRDFSSTGAYPELPPARATRGPGLRCWHPHRRRTALPRADRRRGARAHIKWREMLR